MLLDSEGFGFSTYGPDFTAYNLFANVANSSVAVTQDGPLGDPYMSIEGGYLSAGMLRRLVPSAPTTLIVGFRAAWGVGGTSGVSFQDNAGNLLFYVSVSVVGQIAISGADNTNLGQTAVGVAPTGLGLNWCYFEIKATISDTEGACTVQLNGSEVLTVSGVNSKGNGISNNVSMVSWGSAYPHDGVGSPPNAIAHLYIADTTGTTNNDFLGDVRVQTIFPTANAIAQFSPFGNAANWQNAALSPPNPSVDYNSSATVGAQDTYVMGDITGSTTIFAINQKSLLLKSNASARKAANIVQSGSTLATGPTLTLSTNPTQFQSILPFDPNTSAAWTETGVNTMTSGYTVIS